MILAVVFALAAAMANAINLITQHKASIGAPRQVKGWRLALYLTAALEATFLKTATETLSVSGIGGMLTRTAPQDLTPSKPASPASS